MDWASPLLAQYAIKGNSPGVAEINFVEVAGGGDRSVTPETLDLALEEEYSEYKLERSYIKSWSINGDADDRPTEEVAF